MSKNDIAITVLNFLHKDEVILLSRRFAIDESVVRLVFERGIV